MYGPKQGPLKRSLAWYGSPRASIVVPFIWFNQSCISSLIGSLKEAKTMETIGNGPTAGILNLAFDAMGWHSSFVVHGDDREQIPQWEQPLSRNLEPSTAEPRP